MRGMDFAALALLGIVSAVSAAEPPAVGRIAKSQGLVQIDRAGKQQPGDKGLLLQSGDTLNTGSDGLVQWSMADDSLFLLPTGSSLRIDEYSIPASKDPASGRSFLSLLKGGMRSVTGLIARDNPAHYRVTTPVATMGVRGTDFALVYCNNDCSMRSNTLRKSSLRSFDGLYHGGGRLLRLASNPTKNGLYVKMFKSTGVLTNPAGSAAVTAQASYGSSYGWGGSLQYASYRGRLVKTAGGSGCAFAADAKTAPVELAVCPDVFERFGDGLSFDFDAINQNIFRDLRRTTPEPPASP